MMERECHTCKWKGIRSVHCKNIEVNNEISLAMLAKDESGNDETEDLWDEYEHFGCSKWEAAKRGTCGECEFGLFIGKNGRCIKNALVANQPELAETVPNAKDTPGCGDWQPKQGDGDDL